MRNNKRDINHRSIKILNDTFQKQLARSLCIVGIAYSIPDIANMKYMLILCHDTIHLIQKQTNII